MPIEIKELHIKINADDSRKKSSSEPTKPSSKEECIEEVMKIMNNKEER